MFSVLYAAYLFIEIWKSGTERFSKKLVDLPHCKNIDTEIDHSKLKIIKVYSEIMRESSRQTIKNREFLKKRLKIENRLAARVPDMYYFRSE